MAWALISCISRIKYFEVRQDDIDQRQRIDMPVRKTSKHHLIPRTFIHMDSMIYALFERIKT